MRFTLLCLLVSAAMAPHTLAQCSATVEDISEYGFHTGTQVTDAQHPLRFKVTASGTFRAGQISLATATLPDGYWSFDHTPESVTDNSKTFAIYCPITQPFRVLGEVVCEDGNGAYDWVDIEYAPKEPSVEITSFERLSSNQYRVNHVYSFYAGQRPGAFLWYVYARVSDGVWATQPTRFLTNIVVANPGDKVEAYFLCCTSRDSQATVRASVIVPIPTITVEKVDGDGQRAVPLEAAEKPFKVKVTSSDPYFSAAANFEVIETPSGAKSYSVTPTGIDGDGNWTAIMVVGDKAGSYVVRAKGSVSGLFSTNEVTFTTTAVAPAKVAIVKDTPDLAEVGAAYAVSSTIPTTFFALGVDDNGAKIGPMKATWGVGIKGKGATAGAGTLVLPTEGVHSVTLNPAKAGQLALTADPLLKGVNSAAANLFLTQLYVSVQNTFDINNPVDDAARFVPGMYLDGTNVALDVMETTGQFISLHLPTGAAKGKATFTVTSTSYPGVAMNYPVDGAATTKDMMFPNGQQNIAVDFDTVTGDTWTTLLIQDYGASGTLSVSIQSGKKTYALKSLRLPVDDNENGLPDAGWYLQSGVKITDALLTAAGDVDTDPPGTGEPIESAFGDGLSNYEEFRGFVFAGNYQRFDPDAKDLVLVPDPAILTDVETWNFLSAELPHRLQPAQLTEVTGVLYPGRAIEKSKPIVNPNRAGVPGARTNGQRGVRIVYQEQYAPAAIVAGAVFPVWQLGVLGATWTDAMQNLDIINAPANAGAIPQTPDATQFVEIYPQTLRNHGIATTFANPSAYRDVDGQIVPNCNVNNTGHCDVWDLERGMIVPAVQPAGNAELHTVVNPVTMPGDHYSKYARTCAAPHQLLPSGFTATQMDQLSTVLVGHELGHALSLRHRPDILTDCTSIMFDNMAAPEDRRTWADMLPLAVSYEGLVELMRLWQ